MSSKPRASEGAKERALELLRQNMGARAVADVLAREGLSLGKSTVNRLDRANREAKAPAMLGIRPIVPADARPIPTPDVESVPPDETAMADAGTSEPAGALPEDASAADVELLEQVHRKLTKRVAAALEEAFPDWRSLEHSTRLALEVAHTLARVRPPPKLDPAADPTNLAAGAELRERLARLRAEAEKLPAVRDAIRAHLATLDAAEGAAA